MAVLGAGEYDAYDTAFVGSRSTGRCTSGSETLFVDTKAEGIMAKGKLQLLRKTLPLRVKDLQVCTGN